MIVIIGPIKCVVAVWEPDGMNVDRLSLHAISLGREIVVLDVSIIIALVGRKIQIAMMDAITVVVIGELTILIGSQRRRK
jgi:hypothetical protein